MSRLNIVSRLFYALLMLAFVCDASARQYSDSYPKNPDIDMLNYAFHLELSDDSDSISGTTVATAKFLAGGMSELRLDLIKQSEELEGKGMTVDGVEMNGQALSFTHDNDVIVIDLGRTMEKGAVARVKVSYHGIPAAGLRIGPNKYDDRTFFSDNWSSRARNWLPTVDHPSDKAANEMIVTAPSHYQVVSNGLLIEETDLGDGRRLTHWKNSLPIATWLYFLGVAEFAVQQVDTYDGKAIETWVYRQDRDDGFYDFAVPSRQVIAFYSDLVGEYLYERLANVVSPATGGGMEAASTPAYGENSVTGTRSRRWQGVIIHEIAHQWFGNGVTEAVWNDVWLSEGFATYYTLLYREYAYGHDDFIDGLEESRNRVINFYEDDYDFQLVRDYVEDLNDVSGSMMYVKGAWTLHMLREMIGIDAYTQGVRSYYAEFKNSTVSTADFRWHMEHASGRDLEWYFDQWHFQGGIPSLEGSWRVERGEVIINIEQVQKVYDFELMVDFEVQFADGTSEVITLAVGSDEKAQEAKSFEKEVVAVAIDPNTRLLAKWTFLKE